MIDEEQAAYARGFADASRMAGNHFEDRRQQRHHEVLCLVLKELIVNVRGTKIGGDFFSSSNAERVKIAREYADLAYPPPKQEQL